MKILILIDTSYITFYRFFATLRWYSFSHADDYKLNNNPSYDWFTNSIFVEKYTKLYLDSIIKIITKELFDNSYLIFCMDTPLEQLWRTKIFNNYKLKRKELPIKYNYNNIFKYTYETLIPDIIKKYDNIMKLRVNNVEADDIIACISLHIKNINPDQLIYIITNDEDLLQLGRNNVIFLNLQKKKITLTDKEAALILKKKIIYGDKSDCIDGIFRTGYKIKKKDLLNDDILFNYLKSNNKASIQYELNNRIINFEYIPQKYNDIIITKYNKLNIVLN